MLDMFIRKEEDKVDVSLIAQSLLQILHGPRMIFWVSRPDKSVSKVKTFFFSEVRTVNVQDWTLRTPECVPTAMTRGRKALEIESHKYCHQHLSGVCIRDAMDDSKLRPGLSNFKRFTARSGARILHFFTRLFSLDSWTHVIPCRPDKGF